MRWKKSGGAEQYVWGGGVKQAGLRLIAELRVGSKLLESQLLGQYCVEEVRDYFLCFCQLEESFEYIVISKLGLGVRAREPTIKEGNDFR